MRKQFVFCLAALLVVTLGIAPASASPSAYAQDSNGQIVRSADGLCWRTGYWTPSDAVTGCDGKLVPPIGKPTAPALLATPSEAVSMPMLQLGLPAIKRCDFQLTLSGDNTFGFDKDHLSAIATKHLLIEFQQKMRSCGTIESVVISAYTDRLGGAVHNQRLSDRRAASLSTIITGSGIAIPLQTRGLGSTQSRSQCEQHLKKTELIRCLGQDRRATIEVYGIAK